MGFVLWGHRKYKVCAQNYEGLRISLVALADDVLEPYSTPSIFFKIFDSNKHMVITLFWGEDHFCTRKLRKKNPVNLSVFSLLLSVLMFHGKIAARL